MLDRLNLRRQPACLYVLPLFAFFWACGQDPARQASLAEASGIVRQGNSLLIVDDEVPSTYFRFRLQSTPPQLLFLEPASLERTDWPQRGLALDLESIDVLADGRVVALSERLRALVDQDGLVVQYAAPLSEIGERGLEGLAVAPLEHGASRIAVLWEGGYPEEQELSPELRSQIASHAFRPIVQVHRLEAGARGVHVKPGDGSGLIALDVPSPRPQEADGQRFRAPDLVWCDSGSREGGLSKAGFIVLLSSQNAAPARRYEHHWLQRFAATGRIIDESFDLDAALPEDLRGLNWEGLSWFENGKSLITVCERSPRGYPVAFVVTLPAAWHCGG
jgi:hypothetical protein